MLQFIMLLVMVNKLGLVSTMEGISSAMSSSIQTYCSASKCGLEEQASSMHAHALALHWQLCQILWVELGFDLCPLHGEKPRGLTNFIMGVSNQ